MVATSRNSTARVVSTVQTTVDTTGTTVDTTETTVDASETTVDTTGTTVDTSESTTEATHLLTPLETTGDQIRISVNQQHALEKSSCTQSARACNTLCVPSLIALDPFYVATRLFPAAFF